VGTGINVESQQKFLGLNLQERFLLVFTNKIKFGQRENILRSGLPLTKVKNP
jgi:hypothetical protein